MAFSVDVRHGQMSDGWHVHFSAGKLYEALFLTPHERINITCREFQFCKGYDSRRVHKLPPHSTTTDTLPRTIARYCSNPATATPAAPSIASFSSVRINSIA